MKTILFQGDSITDADRNRNDSMGLGTGYPNLVAGVYGSRHPGEYTFYNRGIGGNRIVDLYARIRSDMINLKPDYMSILVGVNDVWHEQLQNGVDTEKFEKIYCMLIEELLAARPEMKIMIMEPFVLHGRATNNEFDTFFWPEVRKRAEASRRVAEKYGLAFLPLQNMLDAAAKDQPEGYWSADGVHPSVFGHGLIAEQWINAFEKMK